MLKAADAGCVAGPSRLIWSRRSTQRLQFLLLTVQTFAETNGKQTANKRVNGLNIGHLNHGELGTGPVTLSCRMLARHNTPASAFPGELSGISGNSDS